MGKSHSLESSFDSYGKLMYKIFFDLLSVGIIILFLIYLFKFINEDSTELYPINLKTNYYINKEYSCDLNDINNKNPIQFCKPISSDYTEPIKSWFSKPLMDYSTNIGYLNGGSVSIFWFWIYYLLFETELLLNKWLNISHSFASIILNILPIRLIFIFIFISLVTNVKENYVDPVFNANPDQNDNYDINSFFKDLPKNIFITFFSLFLIILSFLIIPAIFSFLFVIVKSLTKNFSWEVNILSFFTLYLCSKTFKTFIEFLYLYL